jgi:hypothetical protein
MNRTPVTAAREEANSRVVERFAAAEPVVIDVGPAGEVVPGMGPRTILTSGAPLPWDEYSGGQRAGIVGAVIFEGLAADAEEAERAIASGAVELLPCSAVGCIGSLAGIYSPSMPVFVVEDRVHGSRAYCNFYEGHSPERLNYGVYNERVRDNLRFVESVVAPTVGEAIRRSGGVPLRPIMRRALHMGDDLHSRNTAATLLFTRELFPAFLDLDRILSDPVRRTLEFMSEGNYFFLRLSMAASKATALAGHGVDGSTIVTAMGLSCKEFAIQVSGLGDEWFRAPIPPVATAKLFDGHVPDDIEYMGGESMINETVGLGGFAQAAAFALQDYSGGTSEEMVRTNLEMYEITVGEHPDFRIPYLGFRGVPLGIDVDRVAETGITPAINIGLAGRGGGQIGAGILRAPIDPFRAAQVRSDTLARA